MPTPPLPDHVLQQAVDMLPEHNGVAAFAARALGLHRETYTHRLKLAARRGISSTQTKIETLHGHNPEHGLTHVVPSPFILKGTSSLYKGNELKLQWVKTKLSEEQLHKHLEVVVKTLTKSIEGLSPLIKEPKAANNDLLCAYIMGDPHYGMLAWAREAGDDFDTAIASKISIAAVDRLIASGPAAKTAILLSVGDTMHADNSANQTFAGTNLDVDSRFSKVLEITIETFRHMILRLLEKHQNVVIRLVKGNHDTHSHLTLGFALKGYFSNNPRVNVDLSPSDFWYYRFGKVLIASTHGDRTKQDKLLGVMVSDRPRDVGETMHRYWYTGHIHHQTVRELEGCTCESFQTLAPKDQWHSSKGYRSGRSMMLIVHHFQHGEIERHRCGIGMLEQT